MEKHKDRGLNVLPSLFNIVPLTVEVVQQDGHWMSSNVYWFHNVAFLFSIKEDVGNSSSSNLFHTTVAGGGLRFM